MEPLQRQIELLTKFGHANLVLSYYGSFSRVQLIMTNLCHATRKQWNTNLKAYEVGLGEDCKNFIVIDKVLDRDILNFISEHRSLSHFPLKFNLKEHQELIILIQLLNSFDGEIKIKEIALLFTFYDDHIDLILKLTEALQRHKISETGIKTGVFIWYTKNIPMSWVANLTLNSRTKYIK